MLKCFSWLYIRVTVAQKGHHCGGRVVYRPLSCLWRMNYLLVHTTVAATGVQGARIGGIAIASCTSNGSRRLKAYPRVPLCYLCCDRRSLLTSSFVRYSCVHVHYSAHSSHEGGQRDDELYRGKLIPYSTGDCPSFQYFLCHLYR